MKMQHTTSRVRNTSHRNVFSMVVLHVWKDLQRMLEEVLDSNIIDAVMSKLWITTDRCSVETVYSLSEEFFDIFHQKPYKNANTFFVAHQQSVFIQETK
jgi:hypothetical protein